MQWREGGRKGKKRLGIDHSRRSSPHPGNATWPDHRRDELESPPTLWDFEPALRMKKTSREPGRAPLGSAALNPCIDVAAGRIRQATAARRSAGLTQSAGVSSNAVRSTTMGVLPARIVAIIHRAIPLFPCVHLSYARGVRNATRRACMGFGRDHGDGSELKLSFLFQISYGNEAPQRSPGPGRP